MKEVKIKANKMSQKQWFNFILESKELGKYGRVLGDVVVDGKNINQTMVQCHLAVAYHGQSKDDVEAEHMRNRDILIENGLHTPV